MIYKDLNKSIKTPVFSVQDVVNAFPDEPKNQINTQLHRLSQNNNLINIKRGIYAFPDRDAEEYIVANKLYTPSYVSLESALNTYGIIPDVVANVTSVTTITSKKLTSIIGTYLYSKINKELYFGFESVLDAKSKMYYNIALPEKALLDFIYIRRVKNLEDSRVDISSLNTKLLNKFSKFYPVWVRRVLSNE